MSSINNVEAMVIEWLNDYVADYPASSDTPKTLPAKFILVDRTGGERVDIAGDSAEILIEVYNKNSKADCSEIANMIADHIIELTEMFEDITQATVNSVISLSDNQKQYYRYQVYCNVFHSRVRAYQG